MPCWPAPLSMVSTTTPIDPWWLVDFFQNWELRAWRQLALVSQRGSKGARLLKSASWYINFYFPFAVFNRIFLDLLQQWIPECNLGYHHPGCGWGARFGQSLIQCRPFNKRLQRDCRFIEWNHRIGSGLKPDLPNWSFRVQWSLALL